MSLLTLLTFVRLLDSAFIEKTALCAWHVACSLFLVADSFSGAVHNDYKESTWIGLEWIMKLYFISKALQDCPIIINSWIPIGIISEG